MMTERTAVAESSSDGQGIDRWIFRDRESMEKRFGLEMERILELHKTNVGKQELLQKMKDADPTLNGNADKAMKQVRGNIEQLQKKESFFKRMLTLPPRAMQAVGTTMSKHKKLSAVAVVAAIIAIAYFTPALAPTAGQYGTKLIQALKTTLTKVGIATPEAATDMIGSLPVTGGPVSDEVVREAGEILQSPGAMKELGSLLKELSQ